jgi:hypothetical protein
MRVIEQRIKESRRAQRVTATIGAALTSDLDRYRAYHAMRLMLELKRSAVYGRMEIAPMVEGMISKPDLSAGSVHTPPAGALNLVLPATRDIAACLDLLENYSDILFSHMLEMRRKQFLLQAVAKSRADTGGEHVGGVGGEGSEGAEVSARAGAEAGATRVAGVQSPSRHAPLSAALISIPADACDSKRAAANKYRLFHLPLAASIQTQNLVRIADSHLFCTVIDGFDGCKADSAAAIAPLVPLPLPQPHCLPHPHRPRLPAA